MKFIKKLGEGTKSDKDSSEDLQASKGKVASSLAESWSTEFMKEQQQQPHQQWGEEFVKQLGPLSDENIDSEAMTSEQKESFWETLQEEWEKMAKDDDLVEHPWLTDFNSTAFQPYQV
ncbi:Peroxisomal targeting signal 1 receptor [Portunus trituberculatus]|uniref:Peroxisomal targeting signal 1 receptor n=1 Tax=Portunus trituberculatus TaxID=210409 RepID=A0A5B7ILX7_PORTR|nr:Peroxisomal targeting signal 1 receptor [Portunus trituberculatus]